MILFVCKDDAKRYEQEKQQGGGGIGDESKLSPTPSLSPFFLLPLSHFALHPTERHEQANTFTNQQTSYHFQVNYHYLTHPLPPAYNFPDLCDILVTNHPFPSLVVSLEYQKN